MKAAIVRMSVVVAAFVSPWAAAQVTLYSQEGFQGQSYALNWDTPNLDPYGFNDRTSSLIVQGGRWEFCQDAYFAGRCAVLAQGQYPSLHSMGLSASISSVRRAGGNVAGSYPPAPPPSYNYYPRYGEPLYQADVTSVRAVGGAPEQRCWVEQPQYTDRNIGGAILGGILGGVLGHQIGGGRGQDVATALGAVGGAAIGSNAAGRSGGGVQRCTTEYSGAPAYWDVSYRFRGKDYRAQLNFAPGPTITVNSRGEPRA